MRKIISYIASQLKKVHVMKERVGNMYEKPEKRDVMGNINGKYILTKEYLNMIIRKDELKNSEEM
jgi:UTP-glucose-1-phosphate uridylyltransferase